MSLELKKNVLAVCVNVLQWTSIKNPGRWRTRIWLGKFWILWILLKWNEIFFSLKVLSFLFDLLCRFYWWFPLEFRAIVCFHWEKWLCFRFLGIIHFNFLQMSVDAFSQRQQFLYFRNSLVKCGQCGEKQLEFYERKEVQVNLIVKCLSFSAYQNSKK